MFSLAILVVLILLSFWFLAICSCILTFFEFEILSKVFGALSLLAGVFLFCSLPHVPLLAIFNISAGVFPFLYKRK
jgi:hypothetical protein